MSRAGSFFRYDCDLCREIAGLQCLFAERYGEILPHRVMRETDRFVVVPSLGQLGDIHLMIVSKVHLTAVAQLDRANLEELVGLIQATRHWLRCRGIENVLVFENGDPEGRGDMGCSVSHLHVHLVASNSSMTGIGPLLVSMGAKPIQSVESICEMTGAYSFADFGTEGGFLLVPRRLPSQQLRKLVAHELGVSEWDWRKTTKEERLVEIVRSAFLEPSSHEPRAA